MTGPAEAAALAALRTAYDREIRARPFGALPDHVFETKDAVFRVTGPSPAVEDNVVLLPAFAGLGAAAVDRAIAAQLDHYRSLGHAFEWKLHDYDPPPDLGRRLARHGMAAQEIETVVVGDSRAAGPPAPLPPGLTVREVVGAAGIAPIEALMIAVWGDERHAAWLVRQLAEEQAQSPASLRIWIVADAREAVAAGWLRLHPGTSFASLWGGSTLAEWRRHGLYRRLTDLRLAAAHAAGYAHVLVDCSADSLPILKRAGFRRLAIVTPMIWTP